MSNEIPPCRNTEHAHLPADHAEVGFCTPMAARIPSTPELRTRDGFTIESIFLDEYSGQMAVVLGDRTVIYHDTPVAPRDQWLVEAGDLAGPTDRILPRFRVIQTLHATGNDPVTVPYGPPTSDLFVATQNAISALAWAQIEGERNSNPVLLKVEIVRVIG